MVTSYVWLYGLNWFQLIKFAQSEKPSKEKGHSDTTAKLEWPIPMYVSKSPDLIITLFELPK